MFVFFLYLLIILKTYLYKWMIAMTNSPAINPMSAKVMAVMGIAWLPQKKRRLDGLERLLTLFYDTSSAI